MIKALNRFFYKNISDLNLTENQKEHTHLETANTNMRRLTIISLVTIVIELLLILLIDLPNIQRAEDHTRWLYQSYLALHSFIIIVCVAGFLTRVYFQKYQNDKYVAASNKLFVIMATLVLSSVAVIAGLDQLITGQITAYVAIVLIVSVLFLCPWPNVLFVYGIPHITLIISLIIFQNDPILLHANIANSTTFLFTILFISSLLYEKHYMNEAKNLLIIEKNEQLNYLARYDELTGIDNRRRFLDVAQTEVEKRKSATNHIALVLIDIDHFKKVNDTYGHPVGDEVLKEFVNLLKQGLRQGDLLARWGGEEFIMLLPNTALPEAEQVSHRLRKLIEATVMEVKGIQIQVTASFGLSEMDPDEENFNTSFAKAYSLADKALYQAKENGRNKVFIYP